MFEMKELKGIGLNGIRRKNIRNILIKIKAGSQAFALSTLLYLKLLKRVEG
jgi:hypothetical protein